MMNVAVFLFFAFMTLPAWGDNSIQAIKEGNALYKQGLFAEASKKYTAVIGDRGQEKVSKYNLGNALYRVGMTKENKDLDGAISDLEQSVVQYDQVLKANAKDQDAEYNKQFVSKQLERLKKKQREQKQNQQQNQSQDKNQKQQEQENKENQNQNNQQNQQWQSKDKNQAEQKQQAQKKGEEAKEGQDKKSDKKEQQSAAKDDKAKKSKEEQQAASNGKELTIQEAKDILEDYERNEEPKGLLNFIPKKGSERPVDKDW